MCRAGEAGVSAAAKRERAKALRSDARLPLVVVLLAVIVALIVPCAETSGAGKPSAAPAFNQAARPQQPTFNYRSSSTGGGGLSQRFNSAAVSQRPTPAFNRAAAAPSTTLSRSTRSLATTAATRTLPIRAAAANATKPRLDAGRVQLAQQSLKGIRLRNANPAVQSAAGKLYQRTTAVGQRLRPNQRVANSGQTHALQPGRTGPTISLPGAGGIQRAAFQRRQDILRNAATSPSSGRPADRLRSWVKRVAGSSSKASATASGTGGAKAASLRERFARAATPGAAKASFNRAADRRQPGNDRFQHQRSPKSELDLRALVEAQLGAGKHLKSIGPLKDRRFAGMEKWQHVVRDGSGHGRKVSVVHYVRDPKTGRRMDFKFVRHGDDPPDQ